MLVIETLSWVAFFMDLLGNICHGVDDRLIIDPHEAGRDPAPRKLVVLDLVGRTSLRDNVGDGSGLAVANEVEGDNAIEVLLDDPFPHVLVAPPVEFVPLIVLSFLALPRHIHPCIVAEFQLDGIRGLVRMGSPQIAI